MIWDWLVSPVDPTRAHDVGVALSWHARTMVLAWGVLAPVAVMIARFFKVLPWQDWPRELDSYVWWRSHWMAQSVVVMLSVVGLALILISDQNTGTAILHRYAGYAVLVIALLQVVSGLLRGSKGGPTDCRPDGSMDGDHYDMTPRRLMFEGFHKGFGYLALLIVVATIASGLWKANAPNWMWLALILWWAALAAIAVYLQFKGWAFDTYQAIWGPDPAHPGNRMKKQGWGTVRVEQERQET